jgi:hypothetical protein
MDRFQAYSVACSATSMRAGARVVWSTTLQNTSSELDSGANILRLAHWFAKLTSAPEFNVLVFSLLINLAWEL